MSAEEYVTCEMCKSASTTLRKASVQTSRESAGRQGGHIAQDSSTRLTMVECSKCGASRTAASIKVQPLSLESVLLLLREFARVQRRSEAGFHAVTRGDRKAAKQAK